MGQNFALNMAEHGFKVAVGNRSHEKVVATVARAKAEGDLSYFWMRRPRRVLLQTQQAP
jgi:6-phosphogluconate dehydrogenase